MAIGQYPSLLVTGPRQIKSGGGYLLGYAFGSTGTANGIQFHESTMGGTMKWCDQVPGTDSLTVRYTFPDNGLYFDTALYVTGSAGAAMPERLIVIFQ